MYYFSKEFLDGLHTKSKNFQNKFFEIIDDVSEYLETEEKKREFQKFIEENHSYDKPGNLMYSSKVYFGDGQGDVEKFKKELHFRLLKLFDDPEDVMVQATHIVICISTSNKEFTEEDLKFLKSIVNFERLCRGVSPAVISLILASDDIGASCFVACLK